jgi:methylthioribulose-1-phosphate dehydratase
MLRQPPREVPPVSSEAERERLGEELLAAMADIHRRGWCDGTGGNFSCLLGRDPIELLMAPSGVDKGSVQRADLIVVDGDAAVIRGHGKASAETLLHLAIVQSTGAGAVLHTHSQAATLLSRRPNLHPLATRQPSQEMDGNEAITASIDLEDLEMLKGLEGITTHRTRVHLPVLDNDQDLRRLSDQARPLLPGAPWGLLIAGHGLYAWGKNLAMARRHLEILEFLLEQRWREMVMESFLRSDHNRR